MDKILMVLNSVHWSGGTNMAVMQRSKKLTDRGYDVSILTLADFDIEKYESKLREMQILDSRVKLLNIYDYYRQNNTINKMNENQMENYERSTEVFEKDYKVQIEKPNEFVRYFKNGSYIKNKRWKDGNLKYINYFTEGRKRIVREEYHKSGYIEKKTYYDPANEKVMYVQFFTSDGFCFLNRWYTKTNNEIYFLFDRNSQVVQQFKGKSKLYTYWLNTLCSKQEQKPFIICDKQNCAPSVHSVEKDNAYKIYTLHSNHLDYPFTVGSPIKYEVTKWIMNHLEVLDKIVVLTEAQKRDIITQYNDYGNVTVIPHSIKYVVKEKDIKEDNLVSMVARLEPIKQINHAIEAFQLVVEKFPKAKLEIYGAGSQEKELGDSIKELGLGENVLLKGHVYSTDSIYNRSLATLLTSESEGFSLVILESMNNGAPVISYDVNYGPSDIITNGVDGYLIKQDIQILANHIIKLLRNPKKAHKMGEKAKKSVYQKFNEEKIIDKWISLFNELKKKQI